MKKIALLILLAGIFSSCWTIPKYLVFSDGIDLTEIHKDGIFITTGEIKDSYTPISLIKVLGFDGFVPKNEKEIASEKRLSDDLYGEKISTPKKPKSINGLYYSGSFKDFKHKYFDLNEAFKELAKKAKEYNANAVINVKIEDVSYYSKEGYVSIGYKVYGLAVSVK